jgi:phosphoribosylformylglycinamidine synthase
MAKVSVMVLPGNGTNCEMETAHACRLAGAERVDIIYIWDVLAGEVGLDDYNFLCLPGGFMDGDDLGAAKAGAHRFRHGKTPSGEPLFTQLQRFVQDGKLILGICNGFQLMVKLGLMPALGEADNPERAWKQQATVWANDSGRFEDRWVRLAVDPASPCVFTRGIDTVSLPVRHGEGKVIFEDDAVAEAATAQNLIPVRYADPDTGRPSQAYPANPNGSPHAVAGLCDRTGRLFGLMPHPEAFTHRTNHPRWTRMDLPEEGKGLTVFRNAVEYLRKG